jgi:hypothetical protein
MFGDHFYHAILRKTVAVFGTIFNDITVVRRDGNNIIKDSQRVPLSYGPKQKFLARLDGQANLNDPKIALKLPRMSFEITNMNYDATTKTSSLNRITSTTTQTSRSSVGQITPYIVDMQLNIIAKNQDDALQIFEQIVPYFQPTYVISVKFIDGLNEAFDVPITLTSVTVQDDYEGDMATRRSLIYTLDFSMKVKFFGPVANKKLITTVAVDMNNLESFGFMEEIVTESSFSLVPATADAPLTGDGVFVYAFTNRGRGYSQAPTVTVSAPTGSASTATAEATVADGAITSITVTDSGLYYTEAPTVTITGTSTNGAFNVETTSNIQLGKLAGVNIPPDLTGVLAVTGITVAPPTGNSTDFIATATTTIKDGRLDSITAVDYGAGYETAPTVTITEPVADSATYSIFQGVDDTDDNQIT